MSKPGRGRADYLRLGDWNAVCYQCGRKRKASDLRRHWQGYFVCAEHWEPRQPQDFARGVREEVTPPWTQPMPADTFTQVCTLLESSALPGQSIPGCMVPGYLPAGVYESLPTWEA